MPPTNHKRYEQPYSSKHVIHDTTDSIRADEPAYIKNFPRFLVNVYKKQTPFNTDILANIRPIINTTEPKSASRKSLATQSPERTIVSPPLPAATFKTLAPATKSPSPLSTMPSDFEHIFHYSET